VERREPPRRKDRRWDGKGARKARRKKDAADDHGDPPAAAL
jgi:hypothetical protein